MNRFFRSAFFPLIVIVLLVWLASETLFPKGAKSQKTTLSELQTDIRTNPQNFKCDSCEVVFNPNKREIVATKMIRRTRRRPSRSRFITPVTRPSFSSSACSR